MPIARVLLASLWLASASALAVTPTATVTPAGTVALTWVAPTANSDGSKPVTPLASYNIYQGASCTALVKVASVPATQLSFTTPVLAPGPYCFAVTAYAVDKTESVKSNTQTIIKGVTLPKKLVISCPIPTSVGYVICSASAQ